MKGRGVGKLQDAVWSDYECKGHFKGLDNLPRNFYTVSVRPVECVLHEHITIR